MTAAPLSRVTGKTVGDYIDGYVNEISDDEIGVNLSAIISDGRQSFGFEGDALVAYVRRAVSALVEIGATPEHWEPCTPPHVGGPVHYGADTPAEIVEGVLAEWIGEGMPDLDWGDYRFNTEENRTAITEIREWDRTGVPPRKNPR